ncbi:MAG: TonB-dependent receptor domain-containing protein [Bryobacteraceae bacterium]
MSTARLLFPIVLAAASCYGQTVTGSLVGHVSDPSAAGVAGAKVTATEVARGVTRQTATNEAGNYTITSMDPGVYKIQIEQSGFKTFVRDTVEVAINSTVRVDASLVVGGVTETIVVTAEAVALKTDRGDLSQQVDSTQFENLPLSPDRNYQSALELIPGSTEPEAVGSAFGNPSGSLANYVNGQNNRGNSFQLDGTINNETNVISQSAIVPPPEAIQVMDVSTNAYDAESGRATGAVVNVQIKSGTNQVHGSAWGYNVNSEFKARNALSLTRQPHTNLTQAGLALGGPIRRNRTFVFGDYQAGRDRRGQNALLSVPGIPYRGGNFSGSRYPVYDPLTGNAAGANRERFPGGVIPASRISPVAKAIFARLPEPNLSGLVNNYEATGSFRQNRDGGDVKVNHKFSDMTEGFVRYSHFAAETADPAVFGDLGGPTSANGGTSAIGPSRIQSASANLTHVLGPVLVTEFRGGLVRVLIQGQTGGDPDIAAKLGIPGGNRGDFFSPGMPRMSVSGYTALGFAATMPFKIAETSSNFVNIWTKQHGNHSIRWGVDIRDLILNKYQSNSDPRGIYTFGTTTTGTTGSLTDSSNAMASFVLGLPSQEDRTYIYQLGGFRLKQYYTFLQDRWVATPRLTLNFGLRYEVAPFSTTANPGDQSRYDISNNTLLIGGYGPVGNRLGVNTDYRGFAPRIGIAYRVAPKTVLRTGYGISYIPQSINSLAVNNYPAQISIQARGPNSLTPAGSLSAPIPVLAPVDVSNGVITPPGNILLNAFNPNARRGYVQSYNFTVEQEIARFVISASYVSTLGRRIPGTLALNAAGPGAVVGDRPLARRFGRTADTNLQDYMLSSAYHALQARVQRRLRRGGSLTLSYTWSKSLDYTDAFTVSIPLNIDLNRGVSSFHRPHNLVISHVLPLPFGRGQRWFRSGPASRILGGFRLSGVISIRSGTPVNITGVRLAANVGQGFTNHPSSTGPVRYLYGTGRGQLWFDTSTFVEPVPGTIGTVGRNTVRGPGYQNWNATLSRVFRLTERFKLNMTLSGFNVTNSTHFGEPSGSFTGAFGQITSSSGERRVRIGARLEF